MKKEKLIRIELPNKILYDVIALAILSFACLFLPISSYVDKKVTYTLSGIDFITGLSILKGKVTVPAFPMFLAIVVFAVLLIAVSLLFRIIKSRAAATFLIAAGLTQLMVIFLFIGKVEKLMHGAKQIHLSYGLLFLLMISSLLIIRAFQILLAEKIISALDIMIIPGLVYLFINNYLPMAGIFIAFKKVDYSLGIFNSPWVGLDNFKYLFMTSDAWIITRNTLLYNIVFIILGNALGVLVGIFLSEIFSKKLQKFYQTSILLPQLISIVIISYIVYAFLSTDSGFVNNALLGKENAVEFYSTKSFWPYFLVGVYLWKGLGYSSIIFLSAIVSIDRSLYEAAFIDGAGRLKQITHIIIPLLKPTLITLVLLQVGRMFYSDFGLFFQVPMNSGALFSVTQTIDTYVYRGLMQENNIAMASAASAYQSIVGFILVISVNGFVRKTDRENALF